MYYQRWKEGQQALGQKDANENSAQTFTSVIHDTKVLLGQFKRRTGIVVLCQPDADHSDSVSQRGFEQ